MPTVSNVLNIAKVSQYLAINAIRARGLFGGGIDRLLPRKLYCIRKSIEWLLNLDPNNSTLTKTANFLYALCGPFSGQAQVIIGSSGGGIIVNPATGDAATLGTISLEFELGITASPVIVNGVNVTLPSNGDNSITIPLQYIVSGSLQLAIGGVLQPTIPTVNSTYTTISYSTNQAIITLQPSGTVFQNGNNYIITGLQYISA